MVPGLSDLNCSNSVCVKLPFLGQEDHSKKKEEKNGKRKRIYNTDKRSGYLTKTLGLIRN